MNWHSERGRPRPRATPAPERADEGVRAPADGEFMAPMRVRCWRSKLALHRAVWTAIAPPLAFAFVCSWAGCKSASPSPYISPRVVGCVVDRQTQQPIPGVQVRRNSDAPQSGSMGGQKGAQRMEQAPAVRTGKDGRFVLDSQRDLTLFQHGGWYSVDLAFQHHGYAPFATNYTLVNASNSPRGEPVVNAGDVFLRPLAK